MSKDEILTSLYLIKNEYIIIVAVIIIIVQCWRCGVMSDDLNPKTRSISILQYIA